MNDYTTGPALSVAGSPEVPGTGEQSRSVPSWLTPSGDTRCPSWCAPGRCSPELHHRSRLIKIDLPDVEITLCLRQWRRGYPDEVLPGWAPAHVSYIVTSKTETCDPGYGDGEPIVVRAPDPIPMGVVFGTGLDVLPRLIAAQAELLALLEQDRGAGS